MYSEIEFESVIRSACGAIVKENVAVFDSFDVSGVEIDPKTTRKFKAALRSVLFKASKGYKALKITATACIVVFSILIGSVIVVPPIRAYVWEVITTWYEEYIDVVFKKEDSIEPKAYLEEHIIPTLPDGWSVSQTNDKVKNGNYYITTPKGQTIYYSQLIVGADITLDNSVYEVKEILLENEQRAYLYTYQDGFVVLVWQTDYIFMLKGIDVSSDDLILIANSIGK